METVSQSCLEEKIRAYHDSLSTFSIARDEEASKFSWTGNGFLAVDQEGELRAASGTRTLSMRTGFRPLVNLKIEGASEVKDAVLTDFLKGRVIKIQCSTLEDECVCTETFIYAHRTKKNIIVEEIKIANPTKSVVKMLMSREDSPAWKSSPDSNFHESSLLMRDDLGVGGRSGGCILCSSVVPSSDIQPKREETFRLTCVVDIREKVGDGWMKDSREEVSNMFALSKKEAASIEKDHISAWEKLNDVTFHISHSFAPNVINGVVINATRYALLSNVRAPLLEDGVSPQEKKILESKGSRRDLCYTGHSTLLYPSRLWTKMRNSEELLSLVDTWLLTLEKRGCAHVISMGANGVAQALVLSLSAATFHDGHLELGMDPADMHREISVSGLELNDASKSRLSFKVGIHDDNRPFLTVWSSSELYACDGGCRSDPIRISSTGTSMKVLKTKPLTSILYVAPNRKHLIQLRNAIHVSEIDVAPAHEDELLSAHKGEEGGLPTFVWIILGVILIAFHVFLIKLLYSEWKKGDSTPYNPYLRQKYFREH